MKKIIWSILCSIFGAVGAIILLARHFQTAQKIQQNDQSLITVQVAGAVQNHAKNYYQRGITYGQLLKKVGLLPNAELKNVVWKKAINRNLVLSIPYQPGTRLKTRITTLQHATQLQKIALINKHQAQIIFQYLSAHQFHLTNWAQIGALRGIGVVTLKKLQTTFQLN